MRIAFVCSAHGFGHLTRQLAIGRELTAQGIDCTYFTHAPPEVVHSTVPEATVVHAAVDVGIAQRDGLTEDVAATRQLLDERVNDSRIDQFSSRLSPFDLVVIDAAPPALEACRRGGIKCLAVGNFDWAWIYQHYPSLQDWSERFAAWQAPHRAISLWPGPGMRGFADVTSVGLIGRHSEPHPLPKGSVLVSFGGFGLDRLSERLPRLDGVTWILAPPMPRLDRDDVLFVEGVAYPSLVAGADLVLTKPGYGIFAEASLAGTRIGWWPRGAFPEAQSLVDAMTARGDRELPLNLGHGRELRACLQAPAPPPVAHDVEHAVRLLLAH